VERLTRSSRFEAPFPRSDLVDGLFYRCDVWSWSGPLIKREVLVDTDQAQALTSGSLEVQVRVGYLKLPHETRMKDLSSRVFYVVRLDLQPDRPGASQELALVTHIPVEKRDIEIIAETNEVPFGLGLRDFATEDITIEVTNAVSILPRNQDGGMIAKGYPCHDSSCLAVPR
jgi:hypothetical protein